MFLPELIENVSSVKSSIITKLTWNNLQDDFIEYAK